MDPAQDHWVLVHAGNGGSYWYNTMTGETRQSNDVAISHVVAKTSPLTPTAAPFVCGSSSGVDVVSGDAGVVDVQTPAPTEQATVETHPQVQDDDDHKLDTRQRCASASVPNTPRQHDGLSGDNAVSEDDQAQLKRTRSTRSVLVRQRRLGHAVRGGRNGRRLRNGSCSTRSVRSSSVHTNVSVVSTESGLDARLPADEEPSEDAPQQQQTDVAAQLNERAKMEMEDVAMVVSDSTCRSSTEGVDTTQEACAPSDCGELQQDSVEVEEEDGANAQLANLSHIGEAGDDSDSIGERTSEGSLEATATTAETTASDHHLVSNQVEKPAGKDVHGVCGHNNNQWLTDTFQQFTTGVTKFMVALRASLPREGSIARILVELVVVLLLVSVLTPKHTSPTLSAEAFFQTAVAGERISIAVTSSGIPAPQMQWRLNGVDIPGATSSLLVIEHATKADSGTYTCVAQNPAGRVVWEEGFLNVVDDLMTHATAAAAAGTTDPEGSAHGASGARFLNTGDATYWRELLASPHANNLSGDDTATLHARRCLLERAPQPVRSSAMADGGASVVAAGEHAGYLSCFRSVAHALAAPKTRDTMVRVLERLRSLHGLSPHPYRLVNVMTKLEVLAQALESGTPNSDPGLALRLVSAVAYEGGLYSSGQPDNVSRARLIPEAILALVASSGGDMYAGSRAEASMRTHSGRAGGW